MCKIVLMLILLFLLASVFSEQKIICDILDHRTDGCIVGVYRLKNTHASLCNKPSNFYYTCYIYANKYIIPINVTTQCSSENKILFYLYQEENSHVSITPATLPVCLDKKFSRVINVVNNYSQRSIPRSSTPVLGLYDYRSSHIQGKYGKYTIFLYIIDKRSPEIYTNIHNESLVQLPVTLKIEYRDDSYLYLCGYRILETDYREEWYYCGENSTKSVALVQDLCKSTCTLEIYAVDLAGNSNKKIYRYYVINPQITLDVYPPIENFVSVDIHSPRTYSLKIINTGTIKLKDIYLWREGCEEYVEVIINENREITHPVYLGDLNVGDEIILKMTISPLKIGRCTLKIIVNATDTKFNLPVKDIIETNLEVFKTVGPYNVMVVDDPVIISILTLIIMLIILLW